MAGSFFRKITLKTTYELKPESLCVRRPVLPLPAKRDAQFLLGNLGGTARSSLAPEAGVFLFKERILEKR
jgi:hypothetical protein